MDQVGEVGLTGTSLSDQQHRDVFLRRDCQVLEHVFELRGERLEATRHPRQDDTGVVRFVVGRVHCQVIVRIRRCDVVQPVQNTGHGDLAAEVQNVAVHRATFEWFGTGLVRQHGHRQVAELSTHLFEDLLLFMAAVTNSREVGDGAGRASFEDFFTQRLEVVAGHEGVRGTAGFGQLMSPARLSAHDND